MPCRPAWHQGRLRLPPKAWPRRKVRFARLIHSAEGAQSAAVCVDWPTRGTELDICA
jgi:hypothetical protein